MRHKLLLIFLLTTNLSVAMDHLTITGEQQKNITVEMYESGHMMYLHPPSLVKYKKDLADFIDND